MKKEESFVLLEGDCQVMLSAPHAVEHVREGKVRYPEPQTADLAQTLHARLDCPIIYKTANEGDDANYDEVSPYKQVLAEYIRRKGIELLLDLHQMAGFRQEQICIGTGRFANIGDKCFVERCVEIFQAKGLEHVSVDNPFAASYPYTVSSYIHRECGIPCVQVEINSNLLMEGQKEYARAAVESALEEIIYLVQGKE